MNKIVIIPGAKDIYSNNRLVQSFIYSIYKLLGSRPDYSDNFYHKLSAHFKQNIIASDIEIFEWNRGINIRRDIIPAAERLKNIITGSTSIFAFSAGGIVAQTMLDAYPRAKIKKLVQVSVPNPVQHYDSRGNPIVNIFSNDDHFVRFGCLLLSPFTGSLKLTGKNISNIEVSAMNHNLFSQDTIITGGKYANMRLFDLYLQQLI